VLPAIEKVSFQTGYDSWLERITAATHIAVSACSFFLPSNVNIKNAT
jgi:hypothetical protein